MLFFFYRNKISGIEVMTNMTKEVCVAWGWIHGNEAEIIRFMKQGMTMCEVMEMNIWRVGPTSVMLRDNYCTKNLPRAAKSVCDFKITYQEYNNFMFINLVPNWMGDVAILYYEVENS